MSKVRGKDSELELLVRRALWARGLRYRLHFGPGKADIVFSRERVAVFIDSCFWHACPQHGERPKTHYDFWERKLARNRRRDYEVTHLLQAQGWVVLRVWEHEILGAFDETINRVSATLDRRLCQARARRATGS